MMKKSSILEHNRGSSECHQVETTRDKGESNRLYCHVHYNSLIQTECWGRGDQDQYKMQVSGSES